MSKRNKCYLRSRQEIVSDMHRSYEEIIKNPSKVSQIFKRKPYDLGKKQVVKNEPWIHNQICRDKFCTNYNLLFDCDLFGWEVG